MTGRFNVLQPAERADLVHLKVLYRPGLVAPGLQRRLEVELYAGTTGELEEELVIKTEQHILRLPLTARILPDAEYARVMHNGVGGLDPLSQTSFTVPSTRAPQLSASFERAFPTSPLAKGKAGPFSLTSTFTSPTSAGPQFSATSPSKGGRTLSQAPPKSSFGEAGQVRIIAEGATPHAAAAVAKQQARQSGSLVNGRSPADADTAATTPRPVSAVPRRSICHLVHVIIALAGLSQSHTIGAFTFEQAFRFALSGCMSIQQSMRGITPWERLQISFTCLKANNVSDSCPQQE